MKTLALVLVLALAGCANHDVTIEPSDRYAELKPTEHLAVQPVTLPALSKLAIKSVEGTQVAVLDAQGVNRLNAYEEASKQNTQALSLLLTAHNGLVDQRNVMLQTLSLEEARANFFQQKYAETENARREQFKEFNTELTIHKAMIVFMGILLVL